MDKKIYDVSFSDVTSNMLWRVSKNDDVALLEFDEYDYQKMSAALSEKLHEGNIEYLRTQYVGQFCCMLEGSLSLEINRRRYDVQAGEICCFFLGDYFRILGASEDVKWFTVIDRSGDSVMQGVDNAMVLMSFKHKIDASRCFKMKEKTARVVHTLYGLMRESLDDSDLAYRDTIVKGYMQILFYQMYSDFSEGKNAADVSAPSRRDELLMRFTHLVAENYKRQRKVSYYADKMCLTPKYLSTVVYEACGKYARDIISEFVMCEAKRCLLNTTMTVQEIGDYLHFSCQSFFGKYFKEHAGMSPQAYRRRG